MSADECSNALRASPARALTMTFLALLFFLVGCFGFVSVASAEGDAPSTAGSNEIVSSCERDVDQVLSVLGKHLSKIDVCVIDEKDRDTQNLLPGLLGIEFIVRPDGKVVGFGITDRRYRSGRLSKCMAKVFSAISYPPAGGSSCPITLPLHLANRQPDGAS